MIASARYTEELFLLCDPWVLLLQLLDSALGKVNGGLQFLLLVSNIFQVVLNLSYLVVMELFSLGRLLQILIGLLLFLFVKFQFRLNLCQFSLMLLDDDLYLMLLSKLNCKSLLLLLDFGTLFIRISSALLNTHLISA